MVIGGDFKGAGAGERPLAPKAWQRMASKASGLVRSQLIPLLLQHSRARVAKQGSGGTHIPAWQF